MFGSTIEYVDHELTPDAHAGALDRELAYFCSCIRDAIPPAAITLSEAAHGIRLAEAIIESAEAGGRPMELAGR